MAYGQQLMDGLPSILREAVHDPFDARALVFALLIDPDESEATKQCALLEQRADVLTWQDFQRYRGPCKIDTPGPWGGNRVPGPPRLVTDGRGAAQ